MALRYILVFLFLPFTCSEVCPRQCDCDLQDGLNSATCIDQNIVNIDIGVPKQVQLYSLSRNAISELDNNCFKEIGYTSLVILNLSYNLIFWIGIHAFSGLDQLSRLDLSNNRLRFLPPDLFWDTPRLDYLDLSGNVFESIKNDPFLMHTKLEVLNLNNCRIKSLPDRVFMKLPNLKKLDLSENYMISLNTKVLEPLQKLQRLELKNDYWQCNQELISVENWILSSGITYEKKCVKMVPKMSEKMISIEPEVREDVDINKVWNTTRASNSTTQIPVRNLSDFERFDREFPSFQAFVIGLEIGLAIGIVGTYIWLRSLCKCGHLKCRRPQTRRERRRMQRIDGELRANLLWSTIVNPDLETPPSFRRQLSLPDGSPPYAIYGVPVRARDTSPNADPERAETPPPPYNECRINIR